MMPIFAFMRQDKNATIARFRDVKVKVLLYGPKHNHNNSREKV